MLVIQGKINFNEKVIIDIDNTTVFSGAVKICDIIVSVNQIKKLIFPNSVFILKYNNQKITDSYMSSIIVFVFAYLFIFVLVAMLLSITGLDFLSAISGAATSISNVGPGLGDMIGPNGNYKNIPDISKWVLSFGMLLGRLELFAILVLFFPSFWRN